MLRPDADPWPELGRVVTQFFGADLVAFLERREGGELVPLYASAPDEERLTAPRLQQAARTVHQVIDSGFLATQQISLEDVYAVAVLPLSWDGRSNDGDARRPSHERAIAGVAAEPVPGPGGALREHNRQARRAEARGGAARESLCSTRAA